MSYTATQISEFIERYDIALNRHHRATGGDCEELNAELDAVTALFSDIELETIGRYLELAAISEPDGW